MSWQLQEKDPRGRRGKAILLTTTALLIGFAVPVRAQSTDMNHPTRMVSNEVKGVGESTERQYYYTFTGGPGEVVIVLDSRAKSGVSPDFLRVDVLDASFNKLGNLISNDTGQHIAHVTVQKAQPLVMQITVPTEFTSYRVRLTGAAKFADAPETASSGAPAARGTTATTAAEGLLLVLPSHGVVRIEMKDGSTKEIEARLIRQILLQ